MALQKTRSRAKDRKAGGRHGVVVQQKESARWNKHYPSRGRRDKARCNQRHGRIRASAGGRIRTTLRKAAQRFPRTVAFLTSTCTSSSDLKEIEKSIHSSPAE